MPTRGLNFDTLPTCDYLRLCAVCPPLPHRYSNIENRSKVTPIQIKTLTFPKTTQSLSSRFLTENHLVSLSKITQNHSKSLTHSPFTVNVRNSWKVTPIPIRSLLLTKNHWVSLPRITQNHSLTHSLPSFVQTEPTKTASPFRCGRKTHSWVSPFTWLGFESLRSCMQTDLRRIKIIASVVFSRCR